MGIGDTQHSMKCRYFHWVVISLMRYHHCNEYFCVNNRGKLCLREEPTGGSCMRLVDCGMLAWSKPKLGSAEACGPSQVSAIKVLWKTGG